MKTIEKITKEFFETEELHSLIPEAITIMNDIGLSVDESRKYSNKVEFYFGKNRPNLTWIVEGSQYNVRFFVSLKRNKEIEIERKKYLANCEKPTIVKIMSRYLTQFGKVVFELVEDIDKDYIHVVSYIPVNEKFSLRLYSEGISLYKL